MKKNFHFAASSQGQKAASRVRGPTTHRRFAKLDNICFPTTRLVWSSWKTKPNQKPKQNPQQTNNFTLFPAAIYLKIYYIFMSFSLIFSIWIIISCFGFMYFEFFMLNAAFHTCLHYFSSCWFQTFESHQEYFGFRSYV